MDYTITEFLKDLESDDASSFINLDGLNKLDEFIYRSLFPLITKADIYENAYEVCKMIEDAHSYWKSIFLKPWIKDKTAIAVMGRFSAGKSSVINSILGEKLLPVDVTPTTAVPAYISFGPKIGIKAVDNDQNIKSIRQSVFSSLTKDSLNNFPIAKLVRYFVIEYKNELLLNKSILDTPGYDSLDALDKQRALDVVKESDAIFWVMDINDGDMSKDALELIKDELDEKSISVIINKADKKSPAERKKVAAKVKDTLKKNNIKYDHCILYSSKDDGLKKELQDILESVQGNSAADYKQYIIDEIDDIIKNVNDYVVQYKKEIAELESLRGEAEQNKDKIHKEIDKKYDELFKGLFEKVRESYISDDLVVEREYWDSFCEGIGEIIDYAAERNFELGIEHKRLEWIESSIEEKQGTLIDKEALRNEAHQIKTKAKQLFEEVLS